MKSEKPTYEELLKWNDESEQEYKITEVLKSGIVCAGMMTVFMVIENFAKIGAAIVFESWKLCPESIVSGNAFLQMGITFVYVYMAWHFFIAVMLIYRDDIEAFGGKWKAFKAWCKKEKETVTTEVKE